MADEKIYFIPYLVIHGPYDKAHARYRAQAIAEGRSAADVDNPDKMIIRGWGQTSHNGNPAFCMALRITDFIRKPGGSASCTITTASLRNLNPSGWNSFFGYEFTVYASISIGANNYNNPIVTKPLFTKPASDARWGDDVYKASSTTLTAPYQTGQILNIVISIYSMCDCGQAYIMTPVYLDDLTEYIPQEPDPYLWRLQHGKDPTNPDPSKPLAWHLVRPFYVCKTINGKKGWCSCEDMTKLVYDAEGHKISED